MFQSQHLLAFGSQESKNSGKKFSAWCKQKELVSLETRITIAALQREVNTTDCKLGESRLEKLTSLDLSKADNNESAIPSSYGITDLRPLATLNNLIELNIGNNKISDLAPLVNLTNLTSLDISKNRISDLIHLMSLKKSLNSMLGVTKSVILLI